MDAVRAHVQDEIPLPDTGSLRGDLTAFLARGIVFLSSPRGTQLARATVPAPLAAATDERGTDWPDRLEQIGALFERAAARGEIAATADRALAVELLLAPLSLRLLITQVPLDEGFAERLADFVLRGVAERRPVSQGPPDLMERKKMIADLAAVGRHPRNSASNLFPSIRWSAQDVENGLSVIRNRGWRHSSISVLEGLRDFSAGFQSRVGPETSPPTDLDRTRMVSPLMTSCMRRQI